MWQTSKSAILWRHFGEEIFSGIFCVLIYVGMTPQTVIGLHSVWVRDMSGTRRFWFGNVSADSMQFGVMSDLIRSWIGLESVSGRPTYARYITDLRPTNHLPSVAELRPTRPRTLPDKTDTTPTYNRQTTDNLSGRDLSNMFERFLPDKFVCPNINRHQTDKTESKPTVNRSLPEFDDFCRLEVGFVSVLPVWLGYYVSVTIPSQLLNYFIKWICKLSHLHGKIANR